MKVYCLALCALLASTAALAESGKLRVCRMPGIVGLTDGKVVELPAGTYTGSCDRKGENCRDVIVSGDAASLGARKSDCVTVAAVVQTPDGKPLGKGVELRPQFSIPGFEPQVRVAEEFK